ncbi:MAG: AAA family ATPase [Nocardioidaceae bacterium]|nr:AAA family ATPase [Nocardioidaceae bacterium]
MGGPSFDIRLRSLSAWPRHCRYCGFGASVTLTRIRRRALAKGSNVTTSERTVASTPLPGPSPDLIRLAELVQRALHEVKRVIVGQEHMVEQLMVTLIAGGHCLLEGVPGVAKTLAVRTLADVIGGTFARVQFTPDLVPSDIVGTRIYRPSQESFDVELGPVFVNFVLADEVNRAPAKVQSAMLELMGEQQVSIGGETFALPDPFIVIATQNPIESEGVYPLPEAQRDRFLLKVDVEHPRGREEFEILRRMSVSPPTANQVLSPALIRELRTAADRVFLHNLVAEYIVRIVLATRSTSEFQLPELDQVIELGVSPRATLGLAAAGRAMALMSGRDYVLPQDVAKVARDVMAHRIMLTFDAAADGVNPRAVVDRVVSTIAPPEPVWTGTGQPTFR